MVDTPLELPARALTDGSSTPKHAQLREILEELCRDHLRPGDMLPGERILEETYGVSRITVRRAIGDLVASGLLRRARGKGTFVAHAPMVARQHLASFSQEIALQNLEATSKILASAWITAPNEISVFFDSATDAPHTHLRRLRLGDGEPLAIDDAWYNSRFAPDLLENDIYKSVYSILETHYAVPITDAEQIITAVAADENVARLLDIDPGTPLLEVIRKARSEARPIEWCTSLYRTDRYSLSTVVTKE